MGVHWRNGDPNSYFERRWRAGALNMMADVQRIAKMNAPVLTSALKNSGRLMATRDGAAVTFGSSRVRYARRRHYENNLHPNTRYYLSRAAESVSRGDISKYFK